ncbi:galactokinase [uncultured Maribacter sp.]|uniref:galactokinase n=1 Tax=uncultured Maribacter sp. TaxID=431308 RepID=UPI00262FEB57|nr:galactokinase [uncultured Maribacter sp.]
MIKDSVESFFKENYSPNPVLIKSPGRVNIIGEHTDYNLGYVLPASIEKAIYFAMQVNDTSTFNIEAFLTLPEKITLNLKGNGPEFSCFWGKYFKAIIEILNEKNYTLKGIDCVFGGDIPIGSGLSSSAALCCGFTLAISELLDLKIPREEIAKIGQAAEHRIGLNCGLMDQYAVLFGKKSNALFLDCKDLSYKYVPINLVGYSWVLINSNIKHELAVGNEYNDRRQSCENIVAKIKETNPTVASLRDVTEEAILKVKDSVSPIDFKRALYVIKENGRVLKMITALEKGDAKEIGTILLEGHRSMSSDFEISTSEIDYLVDVSQEQEGVVGSRMMGGGFGGCTINLIKDENREVAVKNILAAYKKETGITSEYYHLQIDDSVHILNS